MNAPASWWGIEHMCNGVERVYPTLHWADEPEVGAGPREAFECDACGVRYTFREAEAAQGAAPLKHLLYDCGGKGHGPDVSEVQWCHDCTPTCCSEGAALSPETRDYIALREQGKRRPSYRDLQERLMECEQALTDTENAGAAPRAEGLDVERLAEALATQDGPASAWCRNDFTSAEFAERIAAEYARLCGEGPVACRWCGWDETSSDVHAEDCGR